MADLIQLPRPNSSNYTTEQAEKRKGDIYGLKPSKRLRDWTKPEFGTGFCVHITKSDEVQVDHFSMEFESEKEALIRDGLEKLTGNRYIENPSRRHTNVTLAEFDELASLATIFNQPAFVIVTSERPVRESKVFPKILDRLFEPAIMLHYVPGTKKIEPQR